MRRRPWKGLIAMAMAGVMLAAACGGDDGGSATTQAPEERTASAPGVTADTIKIGVGVSDLDGLRAGGISLPAALTTRNLSIRTTSFFDEWNAAGGINGRRVEPVVLTWDPTKPATQDAFCAQATIDNELFAVIVTAGLNARTVQCLLDAGMLTYFGEFAGQTAHDSGSLITVAPPTEVGAAAGARASIEDGRVARGAKVGILSGNGPEAKPAAAAARQVFADEGFDAQIVEINTIQGDVGAINQEAGAAAGTFKANGITEVMLMIPFTNQAGYYDNAAGLETTVLDVSSGNCTPFGASRAPAGALGAECVAIWDNVVTAEGTIRPETDFEKACRAQHDALFVGEYPTPSAVGVPSGQVLELPDGTKLSSDYDAFACTLANIVELSLQGAGVNPTRESMHAATLALGEVPLTAASNGQGSFAEGKTYAADFVHSIRLTPANLQTPRDPAKGTWNGCPAPVNCWVPTSNQWFAIQP